MQRQLGSDNSQIDQEMFTGSWKTSQDRRAQAQKVRRPSVKNKLPVRDLTLGAVRLNGAFRPLSKKPRGVYRRCVPET